MNIEPCSKALRIRCLPVAGGENPYQHLMMYGLRADPSLDVQHGVDTKVFPLIRTVLRERPEVVHFDWIERFFVRRRRSWTLLSIPIFVFDLLVTRFLFGCRFVWTLHNLERHEGTGDPIERWTRRLLGRLTEWVRVFDESSIPRAGKVLNLPPERFRVVPMGSYVDWYPDEVSREEARSVLDLREDDLVLLYFGALRPYKGLEELIDAFEKTRADRWKLLVAGPPMIPEYANAVREQARNVPGVHVRAEFVPDEEIQMYFRSADVAVLPFRAIENSSSVILAMGFGLPVLAPALGVLPSRLRRQPELLYAPGRLTEGLEQLHQLSRSRLAEIGRSNRDEVRRHGWTEFACHFRSLVRD